MKKEKSKSEKDISATPWQRASVAPSQVLPRYGFFADTFFRMVWFELKSIVRNPTFIILVAIGLINLVASLTSFTGSYGSKQYPVTYNVIDTIRGSFYMFLVAVVTFYSGVLVWKERDAKFNEIQDSAPVLTGMIYFSKFLALTASVGIILLTTILTGMLAQLMFGYTHFEFGLYLKGLMVPDYLGFVYLIVFAILFQYLIHQRYIAYFILLHLSS
jgi:hypothetical protein